MIIKKRYLTILFASACLIATALPARIDAQEQTVVTIEKRKVERESPIVYEIIAIPYKIGDATGVEFRGSERLPDGNGEAKVERHDGVTEIEIEVDEMKPAYFFGGDFNTYVLWAASPEGIVENLGEFILHGNRSKLDVTTRMNKFALFVTAEPHFMVDNPSSFMILRNVGAKEPVKGEAEMARIRAFPVSAYQFSRETLGDASEVKGVVHTILRQAEVAINLARQAQAPALVPSEFGKAEAAFNQAKGAAEAKDLTAADVDLLARDAVRKAHSAEVLARTL